MNLFNFAVTAAIVFTGAGVVWQRRDNINLLVKLGFVGLAIWGWYIIFHVR